MTITLSADNPALRLAKHAASTRFENLPEPAVAATATFLVDTLGVAAAGSRGAGLAALAEMVAGWGAPAPSRGARVWVGGMHLPAGSAALLNAYQIHCMEFDCVLEEAVVHPMATILSALLAHCEERRAAGDPVNGKDFVAALNVGVDTAAMLGRAGTGPIRFFRPATCGGFGAAAALANVCRLDEEGALNALGAQYGQTSGTLQPHAEGSPLLGLQVGFNARAALCALDLARAGIRGPHDVVTGPYGYLRLMEDDQFSLAPFEDLGTVPQMTRMSHKPHPSGRLTHGVVHALRIARDERGIAAEDIERVCARVPPLVYRLVGRPDVATPEPNYAKLCLRFVAGAMMANGQVDLETFASPAALKDDATHRYAGLVDVELDDNPDPNALDPQHFTLTLKDGRVEEIHLPCMFGHPDAPLSAQDNEDKFRLCMAASAVPFTETAVESVLALAGDPAALTDAAVLVDALTPGRENLSGQIR
ncbi:MAG: MmgE/PrpD family protein [Pseudomonadota bacterium]